MEQHPLALPLAALMAWTMIIFLWMYATRIPALMRSSKVDLKTYRGGTGRQLDDVLPPEVQWKAHNYNHLLEQPLLFYISGLLLILLDCEGRWALILAWTYVALRVVHSFIQVTVNIVRFRFAAFMLASLALLGLIVMALACALGRS